MLMSLLSITAAAQAVPAGPLLVPVVPVPRSLMIWWIDSERAGPKKPDSDAVWLERVAVVKAHKDNLTAISPCIYGFDGGGKLALQAAQAGTVKHMPLISNLGLDIVPLIAADGGIGGLANLIKNPTPFISAAVDAALKNNYSGYNFDNELRGREDPRSWAALEKYAAGWMAFLDKFADALHAKGKTLSVDIAGCCGWVDTAHPLAPSGHCHGAFATHEFVATTCAQYKASRLDKVFGMSTYSGSLNGGPKPDAKDHNQYAGVNVTKTIANVTQSAVGKEKYSIGFKGGWPVCANYTQVLAQAITRASRIRPSTRASTGLSLHVATAGDVRVRRDSERDDPLHHKHDGCATRGVLGGRSAFAGTVGCPRILFTRRIEREQNRGREEEGEGGNRQPKIFECY